MDIALITEAAERIRPYVKRTPLEYSESLSRELGTNIFVKYEMFQKTGAFKARGAFNKMLSMAEATRSQGVVAVSGGNHAQAVAYASRELGVDAVIVMPQSTPNVYVEATRGYGATVDLQPSIREAFERVGHYQAEGREFIHPFDDPLIIAGQGTVGLEIMADVPDATDVILSIGGGGLAAGVSAAVKAIRPETRVWGVETIGADAMTRALAAGHPVEMDAITSIAKTLGAPSVSQATLDAVRENMESVTEVTDDEVVRDLFFIAERLKVLTEPAAACTLTAARKLRQNFSADSKVVLILCGGNVGIDDIIAYRKLVD
jgi:threonine dehydratase